ncbi:hypothetical protein, partial [Bacillus thuringiensis]|uniref:hypothetical protein n=1 Tax=Bacillus thuringiensis TaxID=1428 RepID=UPI002DB7D4B9
PFIYMKIMNQWGFIHPPTDSLALTNWSFTGNPTTTNSKINKKRGIQKFSFNNLLDSPLFIYLAICGGRISCKRPVGEG